jgi:two-component system response regulator ResD
MSVAPPAARILLVDDDPNLLVVLAEQLRDDGFEVATARDGVEALRRLDAGWPDLLIVDLMMPHMDGITLARHVKSRADLPIIVLSAIDTGDSKAETLESVAEDYVTKPFHYPELRARVLRVMRRVGDRVPAGAMRLGPNLVLDLQKRRAMVGERTVSLTPVESRLLYALAANIGRIVSTDTLLARGWSDAEIPDPAYVWVTMRRLRQKIEADPDHPAYLETIRGVGYRLNGTPGEPDVDPAMAVDWGSAPADGTAQNASGTDGPARATGVGPPPSGPTRRA